MKEVKEVTPVIEAPIIEDEAIAIHRPVQSLISEEYSVIVKALNAMPDWKAKNTLKITNIGFNRDKMDEFGEPTGVSVSITVASKLDQYLLAEPGHPDADSDGYIKGSVSTIFTSALQIAAILKQNGEMAIAAAIIKKPKAMLMALEGARISVFAHEYVKGEIEQSPFSSKEGTYPFEHDTVRYYPYDITLGAGAERARNVMYTAMFS